MLLTQPSSPRFSTACLARKIFCVGSVLPVRLKWGCGHSSSNVEKTVQDVTIHVPGEKWPAFRVTCAKLIVTRSNALKRP